jgi:hypothetical protein
LRQSAIHLIMLSYKLGATGNHESPPVRAPAFTARRRCAICRNVDAPSARLLVVLRKRGILKQRPPLF